MPSRRDTLALLTLFSLWTGITLLSVSTGSAATQIYTYTDDSGTQTFTTDPGSVPDKYQNRLVPLNLGSSSPPPIVPAAQRPPSGNVRVVTSSGEYRMGDHDTRTDAVRMAVEAAKRDALEQVATYLESVTEVKNLDVTRDDIRTYTAGIVMVLDQKITTRLEGDTVVIHVDLTAQVDPDEVAQAITTLRENESAKHELVALRAETDQLRQQLDAANAALTSATSPEQVQSLNQQRQDLLNQLQANALVSQAWTDWVYVTPVVYPYPWVGVRQVNGLLWQAQHLYPRNYHIPIVQNIVTTQSASLPAPPPGVSQPIQPHPSLLVPPAPSFSAPQIPLPGSANAQAHANALGGPTAVPPQTLLPGSANAAVHANALHGAAAAPGQPLSTPLPPTIQQVHPSHLAQPNPPVSRAPYSVPHYTPSMPQHFGGGGYGGGHMGGGRGGGGHHGR
jgi:predicted component of type VI protein secretion system